MIKKHFLFRMFCQGCFQLFVSFLLFVQCIFATDEFTTLMDLDEDFLRQLESEYLCAPIAEINRSIESLRDTDSVLQFLDYIPEDYNQGACGNCWQWASTSCLGISLYVQEQIFDRLSVQYINSCGPSCCTGGSVGNFTNFYTERQKTIPWSNTNADWQDGDASCDTLCNSISENPFYPISDISYAAIQTTNVGQETAINNLKNIIAQNKAIYLGIIFPTDADIQNFRNHYNLQGEEDIWNSDFMCGKQFNNGAGHGVCVVGYIDIPPVNRSWIVLNSWGTRDERPNCLFQLDMDMNYDCQYFQNGNWHYNFKWYTYSFDFNPPSTTTTRTTTSTTRTTTSPTTSTTRTTTTIPGGSLYNLSTRAFVGSGIDDVEGGLIVKGTEKRRVVFHGIGPWLEQFGISNYLIDPKIDLYMNGVWKDGNDNWEDADPWEKEYMAEHGLIPDFSRESALVYDIDPDANWTCVVRGVNNSTGMGLVAIYSPSAEAPTGTAIMKINKKSNIITE
ncbi:hypothetical protein JW824_00175 [bacterium]|nr:hypothetical protein [bacterium]